MSNLQKDKNPSYPRCTLPLYGGVGGPLPYAGVTQFILCLHFPPFAVSDAP